MAGFKRSHDSALQECGYMLKQPPFTVLVGNLPIGITKSCITDQVFKNLNVVETQLIFDRDNFKFFCRVKFGNKESLLNALKLDGIYRIEDATAPIQIVITEGEIDNKRDDCNEFNRQQKVGEDTLENSCGTNSERNAKNVVKNKNKIAKMQEKRDTLSDVLLQKMSKKIDHNQNLENEEEDFNDMLTRKIQDNSCSFSINACENKPETDQKASKVRFLNNSSYSNDIVSKKISRIEFEIDEKQKELELDFDNMLTQKIRGKPCPFEDAHEKKSEIEAILSHCNVLNSNIDGISGELIFKNPEIAHLTEALRTSVNILKLRCNTDFDETIPLILNLNVDKSKRKSKTVRFSDGIPPKKLLNCNEVKCAGCQMDEPPLKMKKLEEQNSGTLLKQTDENLKKDENYNTILQLDKTPDAKPKNNQPELTASKHQATEEKKENYEVMKKLLDVEEKYLKHIEKLEEERITFIENLEEERISFIEKLEKDRSTFSGKLEEERLIFFERLEEERIKFIEKLKERDEQVTDLRKTVEKMSKQIEELEKKAVALTQDKLIRTDCLRLEIKKLNLENVKPVLKTSTCSNSILPAQKYVVMFTGLDQTLMSNYESMVRKLGGTVEERCPTACTVLVTDKVRTTIKFLAVLAQGKPVVTTKWLEMSTKNNSFRDPFKFLIQDRGNELKFDFKLSQSLAKAVKTPLLADYSVFVTPSVKPEPSKMKVIIECAGGQFLTEQPSVWTENCFIVSTEQDKSHWPKGKKNKNFIPKIVSPEIILKGIIRQNLGFQAYLLK